MNSSREKRLRIITLPLGKRTFTLVALRSMMTVSSGPGTLPVLQLPGLFQSPSVLEIQAIPLTTSASKLVNVIATGAATELPARSARIDGFTVS